MKLDIILRTHSLGDVHKGERLLQVPKEEIVLKCVASLVDSINRAVTAGNDIALAVIDDHSSSSCLAGLEKIIARCACPSTLIHLAGAGNNASLKACYQHAKDFGRETIYFVEDDYLHVPSAISEMISAYGLFRQNLGGREVGLVPHDDPDNYRPEWIEPSRIVLGTHRHWRTNTGSLGTFMISKNILIKHWNIYMQFSDYGKGPENQETVTIDIVWKGPVMLFNPIPALAVHLRFPEEYNSFVDWRKLWNDTGTPL